jgi:anti-anti-sigma factor
MSEASERSADVLSGHRLVHPRPGVVVVEMIGEHDLATIRTVDKLFLQLVEQNELLVIDLSYATFIDSTFISAMVKARKHADGLGSRLRVQLGANPIPTRALEITDLIVYLDCVQDRHEALGEPGLRIVS